MKAARTKVPADATELRKRLGVITEDELFALLKIQRSTGRNRQSAGSLPPHYKIGRAKVYRVAEVEAWLRRCRIDRSGACVEPSA